MEVEIISWPLYFVAVFLTGVENDRLMRFYLLAFIFCRCLSNFLLNPFNSFSLHSWPLYFVACRINSNATR